MGVIGRYPIQAVSKTTQVLLYYYGFCNLFIDPVPPEFFHILFTPHSSGLTPAFHCSTLYHFNMAFNGDWSHIPSQCELCINSTDERKFCPTPLKHPPQTPGGTHIFGRTGMCLSNGSSLFLQEILKHGSRFLPKYPYTWFNFSD